MNATRYINTLGFKIFSDDLNLIPIRNGSPKIINTMSPNSYGLSTKDEVFNNALKSSDYLVLDGVYFAFASTYAARQKICEEIRALMCF